MDGRICSEASETYRGKMGEKGGQRMRDIKKRLRSGKELKILAVESQSEVNYIMPWRVMELEGEAYGEAKGSARQMIEMIDNIMRELHCSLERACKVGGKSPADYQQAKDIYRRG